MKTKYLLWGVPIAAIVLLVVFMNNQTPVIDGSLYAYTDAEIEKPGATHLITVYSDFECPFCGTVGPILRAVEQDYDVRVEFKHFPLTSIHPSAQRAAEAAECAREQGQFWAYHDVLFDHTDQLTRKHLIAYAKALDMDTDAFTQCLDSRQTQGVVARHKREGELLGVRGTPTIFLDGEQVSYRTYEQFATVLNEAIK